MSLAVADGYDGNAVQESKIGDIVQIVGVPYVVTVDVGSSSDSIQLSARHLQRTVEDVKGETSCAMGYLSLIHI